MDKDIIKQKIIDLHPELKILDVESSKYVIVENKYGICRLQIYSLFSGSKPTINTALNKTNYFKNQLKEIHPELIVVSDYKGALKKIQIQTEYGICSCLPNNLLRGQIPSIETAIDKNEYFINKSNVLHKNKYDYSLINYINTSVKLEIICPVHGKFKQTPTHHFVNNGCKKCGDSEKQGWWYKNPLNHNKLSNVYILKFTNDNHSFLKVGISTNIQKRINTLNNDTNNEYNISLIKSISNYSYYCFQLEKRFKNKIKIQNRNYLPIINFMGKNECFDNIKNIKN